MLQTKFSGTFFEPDDRLESGMGLVALGDHLFLELLRGLAAVQDTVLDRPSAALTDFPEVGVDRAAAEAVLIDEFEALEELRLIGGTLSTERRNGKETNEAENDGSGNKVAEHDSGNAADTRSYHCVP